MQRRLARAVVSLGILLVALPQCGDSKEEKVRAAELAGHCALDSDCQELLICVFERCHWECNEDRDCRDRHDKNAGRCVKIDDKGSLGVCQLEDEADCDKDTDCRGEQRCASDQQCRDACSDSEPCLSDDLVCSSSGYCAREEEVGRDGELLGAPVAVGGAGGAQPGEGRGGESGASDGSSTAGAGSSGGGAGGAVPVEDGGAPAMGGSPELGGVGGQAGASGASEVSEAEPNDDKSEPNPIAVGVDVLGTLASTEDRDFYSITAPDDPAGGYFEIAVTDLPKGLLTERIWHDDVSLFFGTTGTSGESFYSYLAVLPGETYVVEVAPFQSGQPYSYRLSTKYTSSADAYEPNDLRAIAAGPVPRNTPLEGLLFTGATWEGVARSNYDDWYAVDLEPGEVVVSLTSAPPQVATELYLHGPSGQELTFDNALAQEDAGPLSYEVVTAGRYYVRVGCYVGVPATVGEGSVPAHFEDSYVLTIAQ